MANPDHVEVVRRRAAAIAEWQRQNPAASLDLTGADLTGAALSGADLRGADLSHARLAKANLRGATLHAAYLMGAYLRGADLSWANLSWADLSRADLREADLREADLAGADLSSVDLTRADLSRTDLTGAHLRRAELAKAHFAEATFGLTQLLNCDLSQAIGLSAINHEWRSSIDVDTLIVSFHGAGNRLTPDLESFFVGAGVPKELLAELPRIVGAVEFYSCFIAYGEPDLDFAKRLRGDLEDKGVSCWLYALDATPGIRTWPEIIQEQRQAGKTVVVCSAAALIRDGVLKEIEEQIDDDPNKMVPVSRDNLWTQPGFRVMRGSRDLKPFLVDRTYANFSNDSLYEDSLQRLFRALKRKAE